jgi:hypothetical protein
MNRVELTVYNVGSGMFRKTRYRAIIHSLSGNYGVGHGSTPDSARNRALKDLNIRGGRICSTGDMSARSVPDSFVPDDTVSDSHELPDSTLKSTVCIDCGHPVSKSWQLYCYRCYRLRSDSELHQFVPHVQLLDKDSLGRLVCYDKIGRRYVLDNQSWHRG